MSYTGRYCLILKYKSENWKYIKDKLPEILGIPYWGKPDEVSTFTLIDKGDDTLVTSNTEGNIKKYSGLEIIDISWLEDL